MPCADTSPYSKDDEIRYLKSELEGLKKLQYSPEIYYDNSPQSNTENMPCYEDTEAMARDYQRSQEKIAQEKDTKEKSSPYYPLYLKYEKLFCMLCNGVLNGSITQNCFPEEIKSAYIEHRKEDIVHYRDKYCSRLYSLTLGLSKQGVADRANTLAEIEKLTNMISKIDNMSDEDILNREYEKL